MAAESSYVKTNTMGTLTILDGGAVTLALLYDRGDVQIGTLKARLNAVKAIERRGKWVSDAYAERVYPAFSFSCYVGNIVGGTAIAPGTPAEMLTGLGAYAANRKDGAHNRNSRMLKTATAAAAVGGGVGYYMDRQEAKLRGATGKHGGSGQT